MIRVEAEAWADLLAANHTNDKILESAILAVAIACEKYLADKFIHYATEVNSPVRQFRNVHIDNKENLANLIRGDSSKYVDYNKAIDRCSKIVFSKNPFDLMPEGASDALREVKAIRNYLAHRSDEAKRKYISDVLYGSSYVPVCEFLKKKRAGNSDTNYERITKVLLSIENQFEDSSIEGLIASMP